MRLVNRSAGPVAAAPEFDRLAIGRAAFPVSEAQVSADGRQFTWTTGAAPWTVGRPVDISLRGAPELPTETETAETGRFDLSSEDGKFCGEYLFGRADAEPAQAYCPGQTLAPDTSAIYGPYRLRLTYQWYRIERGLRLAIPGAVAASYSISTADVDHRLLVRVLDPVTGETWETDATPPVAERPNHPAQGALAIMLVEEGNPEPEPIDRRTKLRQGDVLTVTGHDEITDPDGFTSQVLSFQWFRRERRPDATSVPILGATSERYTIQGEDQGTRLSVQVTFTDDWNHTERLSSPLTPGGATIEALLTVSVYGLPQFHETGPFEFELLFSEDVTLGSAALREAIQISGGRVTATRRVERRDDVRLIRVQPSLDGKGAPVVITLPEGDECKRSERDTRICTAGLQGLQHTFVLRVPGPSRLPATVPWAPRQLDYSTDSFFLANEVHITWEPPAYFWRRALAGLRTAIQARIGRLGLNRRSQRVDIWFNRNRI